MLKEVHAPNLGRTVKMGRKAPIAIGPHFKFENYARAFSIVGPDVQDYSKAAAAVIALVLLNDTLGCCVPAGIGGHILGVETGNAGDLFTPTDAMIEKDYSAIGNYVPGNPATDQGCDEVTALNYYCQHGWANGTKGAGWCTVNATSAPGVKAALYVGENLVFGIALPDAWVSSMPSASGFVWDVAGDPDPENGHCVVAVGCNSVGVQIATWGMIGTITWAAVAKYACPNAGGALYVILTPDQIVRASQKAPNGLNWTQLIADMDSMGASIPTPAPSPTPAPAPASASTPPTLAQAETWVRDAINAGPILFTRGQAVTVALKGLAANWAKP